MVITRTTIIEGESTKQKAIRWCNGTQTNKQAAARHASLWRLRYDGDVTVKPIDSLVHAFLQDRLRRNGAASWRGIVDDATRIRFLLASVV